MVYILADGLQPAGVGRCPAGPPVLGAQRLFSSSAKTFPLNFGARCQTGSINIRPQAAG
jgi:hypothetical protein